MRTSAKVGLPLACLALGAVGCMSFCDGSDLLRAATDADPRAIHELGELGRPIVPSSGARIPTIQEGVQALRPNLSSPDPYVRILAVDALRTLVDRAPDYFRTHYPDLLDAALRDPERWVRWRACWALGRVKETRGALRAVTRDRDEDVAVMACWALGRARDTGALLDLAAAIDRAGVVGKAAIEALERTTSARFADPAGWKSFCAEETKRLAEAERERALADAAAEASATMAATAPVGTAPVGTRTR